MDRWIDKPIAQIARDGVDHQGRGPVIVERVRVVDIDPETGLAVDRDPDKPWGRPVTEPGWNTEDYR